MPEASAVAVFKTRSVKGEVLFTDRKNGLHIEAFFTQLPPGEHGFHIHRTGDLRGEGCKAACDHYHKGEKQNHGGPPSMKGERHTGDLGNVSLPQEDNTIRKYTYTLRDVTVDDLIGRSVIVHADEDDYGKGGFDDSLKTGHAGARLVCAIIGRAGDCS